MFDIIKLTVVLVVVSVVAGLAIGITNKQTITKIELQNKLAEELALKIVFPEGVTIERCEPSGDLPGPYWVGKKENATIGYAIKGIGRGYSSDINFIAGMEPDGRILGLTILSQTETPGLGTRVQEVLSKKYFWNGLFSKKEADFPWFCKQFKGIDVTRDIKIDKTSEWHLKSSEQKKALLDENGISAITGSTISTRAVSSGIKKYAYLYLNAIKQQKNETTQSTGAAEATDTLNQQVTQ